MTVHKSTVSGIEIEKTGTSPAESDDWWAPVLDQYREEFGRAPRILHLSNIANNAYNNAKLLIQAGFECDVICADYYHIMGCPEWEDADFLGNVRDHFAPDWTEVDVQNFQRPAWFAQGPALFCIKYLHAKRTGKELRAARYWRLLSVKNRTGHATFWERVNLAREIVIQELQRYLIGMLSPDRVGNKIEQIFRGWVSARTSQSASFGLVERCLVAFGRNVSRLMLGVVYAIASLKLTGASGDALSEDEKKRLQSHRVNLFMLPDITVMDKVMADFERAFPERKDKLSRDDLVGYCWWLRRWRRLFENYDVIIGYGVDSIFPYLADVPYFAMEHGTLREIPWKNDSQGRLTALSYAHASHIFVTNLDCMDSARRLGGDRVSFINHPYDEFHGVERTGSNELRQELLGRLDADHLIFFPTRHDWVVKKGFADKANDILIRAFARLRERGSRVGMVCCRWGHNVAESQDLIRGLGCDEHVLWEEPMGMVRFERTALSCDIVADQFKLGAFGGIVFKALAVGAPVCTYLDRDSVLRMFSTFPPVINCRTEEDLVSALTDVFGNSEKLNKLAQRSREWVQREHSGRQTVDVQMRQYAPLLEERNRRAGETNPGIRNPA